jgi:hypothetical protein
MPCLAGLGLVVVVVVGGVVRESVEKYTVQYVGPKRLEASGFRLLDQTRTKSIFENTEQGRPPEEKKIQTVSSSTSPPTYHTSLYSLGGSLVIEAEGMGYRVGIGSLGSW